jgi:gliding motility-associated lipoprotein GldD
MKNQNKILHFVLIVVISGFASCREEYTPKPHGYVKIEFPERSYSKFTDAAPFRFEYPSYARIEPDRSANAEPFWYNILLPSFNGTIYLSYKKVNSVLNDYIEDSRDLVYKHSIKAESINETLINNRENDVYGILYDLKGNTASALQFFVTDSANNFLRGSLYFNTQPNKDSLSPIIQFVRDDILHIINTIEWDKAKQ